MSLYNTLLDLEKEKKSIINDMKEKIKRQNAKINNYGNMVEEFSTFYDKDIIYILTRLVSMYECEEYVPKIINSNHINGEKNITGEPKTLIFIAKDSIDELNKVNELTLFTKNRVAIIFNCFLEGKPIKFFKYDNAGKIFPNTTEITFYTYVIEFIEEVVSYRIEKNLKNIDKDTLESLLESFIAKNQHIIDYEQERKSMLEAQRASFSTQSQQKLTKKQENQE